MLAALRDRRLVLDGLLLIGSRLGVLGPVPPGVGAPGESRSEPGELGLGPDEYAALTMVLLRLLAFKPDAQRAPAEKKTLNPASRPAERPAPAAHSVAPPVAAAAAPVAPQRSPQAGQPVPVTPLPPGP